MTSINTISISEDGKITLESLKAMEITQENIKNLSELSDEELLSLEKQAVEKKQYNLADFIQKAQNYKKQELIDKNNQKQQDEINNERKITKEAQNNEANLLKQKLEQSENEKSDLEKVMEQYKKELERLREEGSKILDQIKNAKIKGDTEELSRLRQENENLKKEKQTLLTQCKRELPKYDETEIKKLNTRLISGRFISLSTIKTKEGHQTTIKWPNLTIVKNYRSRRRINKTIRKLNSIGNDPKRAVKYVMSKSGFLQGGKVGVGLKKLRNWLIIRDVDKFDEIYNKQKKKFIDDLFEKMSGNMTEKDESIKKALISRLDYYQKAYKSKFMVV